MDLNIWVMKSLMNVLFFLYCLNRLGLWFRDFKSVFFLENSIFLSKCIFLVYFFQSIFFKFFYFFFVLFLYLIYFALDGDTYQETKKKKQQKRH